MTTFLHIGTEIGELVERKNAAYGSSFADAGHFLALLYPQGIQPAQYDDALLTVRIFDKLKRIATDRDALGESPYRDIAGYGILGPRSPTRRGRNFQSALPMFPSRLPQRDARQEPILLRVLPQADPHRRSPGETAAHQGRRNQVPGLRHQAPETSTPGSEGVERWR